MYVCVVYCVFVYLCIHVFMYLYIYVFIHLCIYVFMYLCIYVFMHVCMVYSIGGESLAALIPKFDIALVSFESLVIHKLAQNQLQFAHMAREPELVRGVRSNAAVD